MAQLDFEIVDWLSGSIGEPLERETLASLRITVGPNSIPVTEVEDTIAQTVRRHINVSAYALARWLVVNWWRLRWEPSRIQPSSDWIRSHSLAAIGGDYAWPALTFSSDGELIQLRLQAESSADVAALRYLRDITIDIPAADFEEAVERFLGKVDGRLILRVPGERELSELREELSLERGDPAEAAICKLQALAGIDPGSASKEWLRAAAALATEAGGVAAEEILAAVAPTLHGDLATAEAVVGAMRRSATTVKLDWAVLKHSQATTGELPWERGARMAGELRAKVGIVSGPVTNKMLSDLLDAKLPLSKSPWTGPRQLRGGYRNGVTQGRTALLVTSQRNDSQRFYLARLIGAALRASDDQHVLPVSDAATALQKFERSFAQELLCPWHELDAFTDQGGTDDDGVADAAAHFSVSERVVLSTLVNSGKVPRSRLRA